MGRIKTLVACAVVTGAGLVALAGAPLAAQAATVEVRETVLGPILVNEAGFTLYLFTADKKHQDHCINIEAYGVKCVNFWPPLEVAEGEMPTAGPGVTASKLGTTTLPGGAKQVTFKKHPLYTYVGDAGPAETGYVGFKAFGGSWFTMNGKGKIIK